MPRLLLTATLLIAATLAHAGTEDIRVQMYPIEIPARFMVPDTDPVHTHFPDGLPLGIGSGLTYIGTSDDGALLFYGISDRGPTAAGPAYALQGRKFATTIFPVPHYAPAFGTIRVKDGQATLTSLIPMRDDHMRTISGRPLPIGAPGATGEIPLNAALQRTTFDSDGLDPEGIDLDPQNTRALWICDEYGPFLVHVDAHSGQVLEKFDLGQALPDSAGKRQPERGFGGIAVTPSNRVLAALQSIIDIDGDVAHSRATFIRLFMLDPVTGEVRQFAYPHDRDLYPHSGDARIGDLVAVSDTRFLLIEQGPASDVNRHQVVYLIDLEGATDISGMRSTTGKALETLTERKEVEALGVHYVRKQKLLDLDAHGWTAGKAQGLALLPDLRTLVVSSDNDFGVQARITNPARDAEDKPLTAPGAYRVDARGTLTYQDKEVDSHIEFAPTGAISEIGFFTLPRPVSDY